MKRIASILIAILIFTSLCGCGADTAGAKVVESSEKLLVIEAAEDGGSLEDALNALADAGEITIVSSESEYGAFITSVNGREADAAENEYWAIYTTLGELDGVAYSSSEYGTFEYAGKTLSSASYGASGLPMAKGELYILALESY